MSAGRLRGGDMNADTLPPLRDGVPMPPTPSNYGRWSARFRTMQIGQCFDLPPDVTFRYANRRLYGFAKNYGIKISIRKVEGKYTVWRVA